MTAQLIMFIVGMNIVSQLHLIRKDKEIVTKRDYFTFLIQSLFITGSVLLMRYVYMTLTKL